MSSEMPQSPPTKERRQPRTVMARHSLSSNRLRQSLGGPPVRIPRTRSHKKKTGTVSKTSGTNAATKDRLPLSSISNDRRRRTRGAQRLNGSKKDNSKSSPCPCDALQQQHSYYQRSTISGNNEEEERRQSRPKSNHVIVEIEDNHSLQRSASSLSCSLPEDNIDGGGLPEYLIRNLENVDNNISNKDKRINGLEFVEAGPDSHIGVEVVVDTNFNGRIDPDDSVDISLGGVSILSQCNEENHVDTNQCSPDASLLFEWTEEPPVELQTRRHPISNRRAGGEELLLPIPSLRQELLPGEHLKGHFTPNGGEGELFDWKEDISPDAQPRFYKERRPKKECPLLLPIPSLREELHAKNQKIAIDSSEQVNPCRNNWTMLSSVMEETSLTIEDENEPEEFSLSVDRDPKECSERRSRRSSLLLPIPSLREEIIINKIVSNPKCGNQEETQVIADKKDSKGRDKKPETIRDEALVEAETNGCSVACSPADDTDSNAQTSITENTENGAAEQIKRIPLPIKENCATLNSISQEAREDDGGHIQSESEFAVSITEGTTDEKNSQTIVLQSYEYPKLNGRSLLPTLAEDVSINSKTNQERQEVDILRDQVKLLLIEKQRALDRLHNLRGAYEDRLAPAEEFYSKVRSGIPDANYAIDYCSLKRCCLIANLSACFTAAQIRKLEADNVRLKKEKEEVERIIDALKQQIQVSVSMLHQKLKETNQSLEEANRRNDKLEQELVEFRGNQNEE